MQPLRGRLKDAHIGLVRDQPVHLRRRHACRRQDFAGDIGQHLDRELEHRLPVHAQEGIAGGHAPADLTGNGQDAVVAAVGVKGAGQQARLIGSFHHHGTGAVTEQDAGAAVLPVEDARKHLGADHQRALMRAGADELFGDGHGVDKTAAHRLHVEGRCAIDDAELVLQQGRRTGKYVVGSGGRDDDQIDVPGLPSGRLQRAPAGFQRQVAAGDAGRCQMAVADAGSLDDPLVRRVESVRGDQGRVADRFAGQVAAGTADSGMDHRGLRQSQRVGAGITAAMRAAMASGRRCRASSAAFSSAQRNAIWSAEPWLLTTMPLSPSRLAPL